MNPKGKKASKDSGKIEVPRPNVVDKALELGRTVGKLVPPLDFMQQVLFSFVPTPFDRRVLRWREAISQKLADRKLDPEALAQNEAFMTTVFHATQIAVRNHQEEKLEALRNAVLNSALPDPPDESLQLIFLSFIDVFTPWHMQVLRFFHNPSSWMKERGIPIPTWTTGSLRNLFSIAFKDIERPSGLDDFTFQDLENRGLFEGLGGMASMQTVLRSRTTDLGKAFLKFITSPPEEE
jgi:hypothetical protein